MRPESEIRINKVGSRIFKYTCIAIVGSECLAIIVDESTKNTISLSEIPAFIILTGSAVLFAAASRKLDRSVAKLEKEIE